VLNVGGPFVLVADDDTAVCRLLEALLAEAGHRVETARESVGFAAAFDRFTPDLVVLGGALTRVLPRVKERRPETVAIVLGGSVDGAFDVVPKPVDRDRFLACVRNAATLLEQARELRRLRAEVRDAYGVERLLGTSPKMRDLRARVRELAGVDGAVFVRGESGAGKELVARVMHYAGPRASKPFVDASGTATPEREIFARLEQAAGGTLYVEEFAALASTARERLLAATSARAVVSGPLCFEAVPVVDVPPLRERPEDLPELAPHFLQVAARVEGRPVPSLSDETLRILQRHGWPGNVRELENAMHRAVVLCDTGRVDPPHLPPPLNKSSGYYRVPDAPPKSLVEAVEDLEKRMIREAMEKSGWVRALAARALGVTERALAYKLDIHGIQRD
jgi:DNA-binding NtrC family response regulator